MANTYRTVRIQGDGVQREAIANEAFYPGALLEKLSTGKVQKHTGKGCVAPTYTPRPLMVAMENSLVGIGVGTGTLNGTFVTITKQWAAGDNVSYLIPGPGDVVAMLLKGGSAAVVVGDPLTSNGDGTLIKASSSFSVVVGRAREAKDLSASAGVANALIAVEL